MPSVPALDRFRKLIDTISRLYANARRAQVQFAWPIGSLREETGRLIVVEEQDGKMRAEYGKELIPKLSKGLTKKYGPGFSDKVLWNMRQFYLRNPILPTSGVLDWSDYVELLPVKDEKTRKRLEQRILKEDLNTVEIRQVVREVRDLPKPSPKLPPLKRPADLRLNTFSISPLRAKLKAGQVLIDCGFFVSWPVVEEELKGLISPGRCLTPTRPPSTASSTATRFWCSLRPASGSSCATGCACAGSTRLSWARLEGPGQKIRGKTPAGGFYHCRQIAQVEDRHPRPFCRGRFLQKRRRGRARDHQGRRVSQSDFVR